MTEAEWLACVEPSEMMDLTEWRYRRHSPSGRLTPRSLSPTPPASHLALRPGPLRRGPYPRLPRKPVFTRAPAGRLRPPRPAHEGRDVPPRGHLVPGRRPARLRVLPPDGSHVVRRHHDRRAD